MTKIGFIGQGWIGKHYADDFENRLYEVVRYSLEQPFVQNKDAIRECVIVFIAVPTPTTMEGYSYKAVEDALLCVSDGATAVIKSTLTPGTTETLQKNFPNLFVIHSPEFLAEITAAYDAAKPKRNLLGIPHITKEFKEKAEEVLRILPEAPYNQIMSSKEAEIVKYAGNCFLYSKIMYMNILYNLVESQGADWEVVREAMVNDPRIGSSHTQPLHDSGRGAGGHCFIKDFEAFRQMYQKELSDPLGDAVLKSLVEMNNSLLLSTDKNIELLQGVYGDDISIK